MFGNRAAPGQAATPGNSGAIPALPAMWRLLPSYLLGIHTLPGDGWSLGAGGRYSNLGWKSALEHGPSSDSPPSRQQLWPEACRQLPFGTLPGSVELLLTVLRPRALSHQGLPPWALARGWVAPHREALPADAHAVPPRAPTHQPALVAPPLRLARTCGGLPGWTLTPAGTFLGPMRAQSLGPALSLACPHPHQPTSQAGREALARHSRVGLAELLQRGPEQRLMSRPARWSAAGPSPAPRGCGSCGSDPVYCPGSRTR